MELLLGFLPSIGESEFVNPSREFEETWSKNKCWFVNVIKYNNRRKFQNILRLSKYCEFTCLLCLCPSTKGDVGNASLSSGILF